MALATCTRVGEVGGVGGKGGEKQQDRVAWGRGHGEVLWGNAHAAPAATHQTRKHIGFHNNVQTLLARVPLQVGCKEGHTRNGGAVAVHHEPPAQVW